MQPKHFNTLAIAAVISLIAAGVVHSSYNSFNDDVLTGQRLFPRLEANGNATGQVAIQRGETTLTFKKSEDGKTWSLVERAGYPVDPKKIRELVVKLGQAELIEKKTRNEELYGQLDLADPTAKGASSKLVRLADSGNKTIAEVVIGSERRGAFGTGQAGTYVRVPGNPQTWLAKLELNASTNVSDWVEPVFFKIDDTKISSIVVKEGDNVVYKLARAEAEKKVEAKDGEQKDEAPAALELVDVPAGKKVAPGVKVDDMVKGVRTLELKDVRAAEASDAKPAMTAEITMDDGARYLVGMTNSDGTPWLTVAVLAEGTEEKVARTIGDATKGWVYEIPQWRADQTFKKVSDVFEALEEEPKMSVAPEKPAVPAGLGPRVSPGMIGGEQPEPADAGTPKQ